jgi:hypothetical protein
MSSRFEPQRDNPLRPLGSVDDATNDAVAGPDREDDDDLGRNRTDALPEHEHDDDATVGGGVLEMGGTSVDRGTGTLAGQAQGDDDSDAGPGVDLDDADEAIGLDQGHHSS